MNNNHYPSWWDKTLTIYNKYEDEETHEITWYKSIVSNCFWKYVDAKVVVGQTILDGSTITCRIPKDKRFLLKYLWDAETNKSKTFTIATGDIIVCGEVDDAIDEYTKGTRSTDLIKKYKDTLGVMYVERCTVNTDGGRHNEHYYVTGK